MKPKAKKKPAKRKIHWFARAGLLTKTGPFPTQVRAVEAVQLSICKDDDERAWREWQGKKDSRLMVVGQFYANTFVWPEYK